ncbi:MAG: carbon starvation protein A [Sphingobium yanoikuyae]|nr:carbon starvation protein A [Sphingobium yanoikuyae]
MTRHIPWILTALVGAVSLAVVAVSRGETVNALWIVVASVSCFLVAYRYYALFIAREVMRLDPARPTPAVRRADGLDYVATDRTVLFGHHFAAIAGAGPLVGPVLAAQMGYLPGTLWIIAGVVLAGAVQDFMVLFISMRRDGKSLGELIRMEMGQVAGTIALFGAFMIMVIILAVLALIVVKALAESPWGMFTVAATVPLAMAMGAYTRWIRPGRIGEVSILGLIGLLAAIVYGQAIAESPVWGPTFTFTPVQLCWILIGYGAMLMEAFVAIMALVGASILDPGIYFTMNSPAAVIGTDPASVSAAVTAMGFPISPDVIVQTAKDVGEHTIISRAGGAPTLAVAMAEIFSHVFGGPAMKAFWYHFAILFEALFILTAVDAGTRAGRFMLQDLIALAVPSFKDSKSQLPGFIATGLCVAAWGFFLYQGVTDPLGGVNTLWPVFGISNQMLAAIALMLGTAVLFRMKRDRFAWVTMVPAAWLLICTLSAGFLKLFSTDAKVGFLAHAAKYSAALDKGEVLAPAKSMAEMRQILFNDYVDAGLVAIFLAVVLALLVFTIRTCLAARGFAAPTAREIPAQLVPTP